MPLAEPVSANRSRCMVQWMCSPARQAGHDPHPACGITTTRSPVRSRLDCAASTTTPTASCPSSQDGLPARHDCHSVHMGATKTSTVTMSPDACGSERSDTNAWRGPVISMLRIHSSCCEDTIGRTLLRDEPRRMPERLGYQSQTSWPVVYGESERHGF